MDEDSRAFAYLGQAHDRFLSIGNTAAAEKIADLYRDLSGGCTYPNHTWPISGPWCYCGRERWRNR